MTYLAPFKCENDLNTLKKMSYFNHLSHDFRMVGNLPVLLPVNSAHVPREAQLPRHPVTLGAEDLRMLRDLSSALLEMPFVHVPVALGTKGAHRLMRLHPLLGVERLKARVAPKL